MSKLWFGLGFLLVVTLLAYCNRQEISSGLQALHQAGQHQSDTQAYQQKWLLPEEK